jgi:gp16 family phage-associated protein
VQNASKNYQRLRSKLIARGFTLRSWALKNGFPPNTVYGAARGQRSGVKATLIRNRLIKIVGDELTSL